jgi:RNA polymerase sigma-B factor
LAWTSPSPLPFTVDTEQTPPQLTLRIRGDLDFSCASALASAARVPTRGVTQVRLDLTHLDFCDVAGLRALDDLCARHVAAGREVTVCGARPFLRKIAALSGLLPKCLVQHEPQER